MSAPVSIREFARLDGCNDKLVRRAINAGKLTVDADGKLDPALAGSGWRKQNRRADIPADTAKPVRTVSAPVRAAKVSAPDDDGKIDGLFDAEAEDFIENVLKGTFALTGEAERIKENALAAKHLLAARKEAASLVDIGIAESVLFEAQHTQRDAWINFPAKVGPLIAAELEVEADKVVEVLTAHVHQQLTDLGEPEADFSNDGQD